MNVGTTERPFWRDPTKIGAIIAFVFSAGLNVLQYISHDAEIEQKNQDIVLERSKWDIERTKLTQEIAEKKKSSEDKDKLRADLTKADNDMKIWQDSIFNLKADILLLQGKKDSDEKSGRPEMAKADEQSIQYDNDTIAVEQKELDNATSKRNEILALLK